MIGFTARSLLVKPESSDNLENFLGSYHYYGAYYLVPAIWRKGLEEPRFLTHIPVLKRQLNVFDAVAVTDEQIEQVAVQQARELAKP